MASLATHFNSLGRYSLNKRDFFQAVFMRIFEYIFDCGHIGRWLYFSRKRVGCWYYHRIKQLLNASDFFIVLLGLVGGRGLHLIQESLLIEHE